MAERSRTRLAARAALLLLSAASFVAVTLRLRLDPDVASLLPDRGEAASLQRYVRAFGGGDLAVVLVQAESADESAAIAARAAEALRARPSVRRAEDRVDAARTLDPVLVWRHADARGRARLAEALTPDGMRARLRETRALLLAPGGGALAETVAEDPLRLTQLAFEVGGIGSGVRTQADGTFSTDDGRTHLVLVQPAGQALRGADAKAFVDDAEAVLAPLRRAHPGAEIGLTGGHAIAAATEAMLTRDITVSGTAAMVLASAVFALIFRRVRALAAVMPPLALGTLWTAGVASALPGGLSAIAVAFMSVVVGVGVDTGVHVYAALLDARRAGHAPREAARIARARTARTVLIAAGTAGAAFAALGLSEIRALRQLGLLSGAGEVLTAIAIVLVTPEIGAWLERGPPPPPLRPSWTAAAAWLGGTRARAAVVLALAAAPLVAVAFLGPPPLAEAFVAVRPRALEPLRVQEKVFEAFGGRKGQYVVLVDDADAARARARADAVAEKLAGLSGEVEAVDALTALAPAPSTQAARFDARDALDLPAKAAELERALREVGFVPERFARALDAMRHAPRTAVELSDLTQGATAILSSRYLGNDRGDHLVAIYVRPRESPGSVQRIEQAVREADPGAALTGYARLEALLRESLGRDLPRIALVAGALVVAALAASLRRPRDVLLAAAVVSVEIAAVLVLVRVLGIPMHVYDALVIPVLLGVTVDEGMFLLHRARESEAVPGEDAIAATLRDEGPPVAATALTTAAGFGALAFCDFDGLSDLGRVGALGSATGLVVALCVVPAGLRLVGATARVGQAARPRR